jgi:hypothetical protein
VCALLVYYLFYVVTNKIANIVANSVPSTANGKRTKVKDKSKEFQYNEESPTDVDEPTIKNKKVRGLNHAIFAEN